MKVSKLTPTSTMLPPNSRLTALRFGEFLCDQQLITEEELLAALGDHWSNGGNIGSAICRMGLLSREEIERQATLYHSIDTVEV